MTLPPSPSVRRSATACVAGLLLLGLGACAKRGTEEVIGAYGRGDPYASASDGRKPGYVSVVTVYESKGPDHDLHGLMSGTGKRLLEADWNDICLFSERCVFATPGTVAGPDAKTDSYSRIAITYGPDGASAGKPEPTRYTRIVPVGGIPDAADPYAAALGGAGRQPVHVGTGKIHNSYEIEVLDEDGRVVSTIPGCNLIRRVGNVIVISTEAGLRRVALDGTPIAEAQVPLVELDYLEPEAQFGGVRIDRGQLFAFALPVRTAAGVPLFWPLDGAIGRERADPDGRIRGFEPVDYQPSPSTAPNRPRLAFWIVHGISGGAPIMGLETPGGAVSTGLIYRKLEPVPWDAGLGMTQPTPPTDPHDQNQPWTYPLHCYLAELEDGRWVRIALTRGDRFEFPNEVLPWSMSTTAPLPDRDAAIAAHKACVQQRVAEVDVERQRRNEVSRLAYEQQRHRDISYFENALQYAELRQEDIERAYRLGGSYLMQYARKVLTGDRTQIDECAKLMKLLRGHPDVSADDSAWLGERYAASLAAEAAWQAEAPARAAAYHEYLADFQKRRAEADQRSLEEASHVHQSGGYYQAPDENPADAADAARQRRYTSELERYNSGQQNWAPVAP